MLGVWRSAVELEPGVPHRVCEAAERAQKQGHDERFNLSCSRPLDTQGQCGASAVANASLQRALGFLPTENQFFLDMFALFDGSCDGVIRARELGQLLWFALCQCLFITCDRALGLETDKDTVLDYVDYIDFNSSGFLTFLDCASVAATEISRTNWLPALLESLNVRMSAVLFQRFADRLYHRQS